MPDNVKNSKPHSIFIVAGETSGDEHAALAVEAFLRLEPEARFFGMGGEHMRSAGVETIVDSEEAASVMGFTEVIAKLGVILAARRQLIDAVKERKPDIAMLVDYPDFNFSLFKTLYKENIPVLYYVSPQLWAWRKGRAKTIKKYVAKVLSIIPFEERFFASLGISAEYVGHPFLDRKDLETNRIDFLTRNGLDPEKSVLALLPGSRNAELERLLPTMLEALSRLRETYPDLQAILPVAQSLSMDLVREMTDGADIILLEGQSREVLNYSDSAVVASGTATVEAALGKNPFVVIYKLAPVTYRMARILIRGVKFFAMPNLIAEREVVPELLQEEANAERISSELSMLLSNKEKREEVVAGLEEVGRRLQGNHSASQSSSERVALQIGQMLELSDENCENRGLKKQGVA